MATKQVSDAIAPGEIVSVEKCAVMEIGNRDDDVVVKFDSSPFEYCLPGSAIRRQPPPQAGSSGGGLKVGDVMQVSNCTITEILEKEDQSDLVVKFDSSPYEYCLPASALTRIPPAQAEPVAVAKPHRRIEFTLKVGADSIKDLQQALGQVSFDIEAGSRGPCVSGGVTSGWCWNIKEDESITHKMYVEQLQQHLAQSKESS
jgi:hypothetical protein